VEKVLFKGQVNDKMVEVVLSNDYPKNKPTEQVIIAEMGGRYEVCKPKELKLKLKEMGLNIKIDEKEIVFD